MSDRTPTEVIESAYEAILGRGHIDDFLDHFAEDGVLVEADTLPYAGTYRGKAAIKAALESVFPYYSSFSYAPEVLTANGPWVIAYGTFSITSAETGKSIAFKLAEVSKVENGKITLIHPIYSDTKALLETMGL
jgi:uncharacterized protein